MLAAGDMPLFGPARGSKRIAPHQAVGMEESTERKYSTGLDSFGQGNRVLIHLRRFYEPFLCHFARSTQDRCCVFHKLDERFIAEHDPIFLSCLRLVVGDDLVVRINVHSRSKKNALIHSFIWRCSTPFFQLQISPRRNKVQDIVVERIFSRAMICDRS